MMQVQKWGNSLGVRIPKALAMKAGLEEGSEVDIDVEKGHLVIKPKTRTLEELLSQITPDNLHSEIQTGKTQGRETW
ncbi:AbrB/MazE/SpoVT family DNA-binding domain-containing protein [Paenibacillus sp. YN15]|uniref:AbrB/MazE/SpoVT family DNA-binding domain-containing protein n=1 Tax=Paenibacillus sp. YN15 TaxID=1742774 RepID=UPI000DCDE9A9|nr:AbrB/MazE/SpoVT family DNA-binding domain-containing protein [Paenibacillus sp. YN15]RAU94356.1 AbrB/MazE/SpoVT family DNA-binding domain-containing protein [Paenibacillus sp. YN15]